MKMLKAWSKKLEVAVLFSSAGISWKVDFCVTHRAKTRGKPPMIKATRVKDRRIMLMPTIKLIIIERTYPQL
jgi:hypothetical protein